MWEEVQKDNSRLIRTLSKEGSDWEGSSLDKR